MNNNIKNRIQSVPVFSRRLYVFRVISLLLFFFAILLSSNSVAQVTIGSAKKPLDGVLLMLDDGTTGGAGENSKKGLGLPRVELQAFDKLKMGADATEHTEKDEHVGLMVYNVNMNFDQCEQNSIPPGVHVWNGNKWMGINTQEHRDINLPHPDGLFDSNVVLMTESGVLRIPVRKAYAIWEFFSSELGGERLPVVDLSETVAAEIIWQEKNTLGVGAPTLIVNDGSLSMEGVGRNASIKLETSGAHGNAVVAVKIGGVIRWSWHIWVSDSHNSNTKSYGDLEWMDRNMGAISATPGDAGTKGLFYQWGRPTPFPGGAMEPSTMWGGVAQKIYNAEGVEVSVTMEVRGTDRQANLVTAITKPLVFLTASDQNGDWYSYNETNAKQRWDTRWTTEQLKDLECPTMIHDLPAVFDPCPTGWGVAKGINNHSVSPWAGLERINPSNWATDRGWNWADAGYYPAAGCRGNANGVLAVVGTQGYYWSASPDTNLSGYLFFNSANVNVWGKSNRAGGLSVRCVKEK